MASLDPRAVIIGLSALILLLALDVHEVRGIRADLAARDKSRCECDRRHDPELPVLSPMHAGGPPQLSQRSEEHTSELQSLMRSSYDVFCLKKKQTDLTQ